MLNLSKMTEREMYIALTSIKDSCFKPKIEPSEGNKINIKDVLEYFKDTDFSVYFKLLKERSNKDMESVKAYNTYVYEHPMIELIGKFIDAGLLDNALNYKDNYFIPLGDELLTKKELSDKRLCEGLILRNGDFFPVRHKEAHNIGSMWLYLHGYRLDNIVRYTSSFLGEPYFSSLSDFVTRPTNAIAFSSAQATAMCNILVAKCNRINSFAEKFCDYTDLCLMPGADSYCMLNNLRVLQDVLGKDCFDAQEIIADIRREAVAMGIPPSKIGTEPGADE